MEGINHLEHHRVILISLLLIFADALRAFARAFAFAFSNLLLELFLFLSLLLRREGLVVFGDELVVLRAFNHQDSIGFRGVFSFRWLGVTLLVGPAGRRLPA